MSLERDLLGLAGQAARAARALADPRTLVDLVAPARGDQLAERDPEFLDRVLPLMDTFYRTYFRAEVRGLERIPEGGPVLLVGNHSGGTVIADTFVFANAFYRHFGTDRLFHQLAHDLVLKLPGLGIVRKYGTVSASHDHARQALRRGAAVLVYPGGDWETFRPTWHSDRIEFGGRMGFVRLALEEDVPIVPVVSIGGQETALFLTRGERLAQLLQLDRLFRIKVLPVALAPPWGGAVMDLPLRLPLPAKITIEALDPIDLREELGPDPPVEEAYELLTSRMQGSLSDLSEERTVPILG